MKLSFSVLVYGFKVQITVKLCYGPVRKMVSIRVEARLGFCLGAWERQGLAQVNCPTPSSELTDFPKILFLM